MKTNESQRNRCYRLLHEGNQLPIGVTLHIMHDLDSQASEIERLRAENGKMREALEAIGGDYWCMGACTHLEFVGKDKKNIALEVLASLKEGG